MKKLFIVTLAVLFFAGAAYAVEYDYSGMLNTRGTYLDNDSGLEDKSRDYMWYDMEFDSTLDIKPSDKSLIRLRFEVHDQNFGPSPNPGSDPAGGDDNIYFNRAWGKYTFDNGMSTSFGLMSGGTFGTAFADNGDSYWRVRFDGTASFGAYGFILEKGEELGTGGRADDDPAGGWDSEKDDTDAYAIYLVTKAGDITLNFLGKYAQVGDATGGAIEGGFEFEDSDLDIMAFVAAAMGSFGSLGFESEFMVKDYSYDGNNAPEDWTVWGLYGNVWMTMDAAKIGGYAAYGSWDDDGGRGFDFGADFYFGSGVGDSQAWGTGNNGTWSAVTLLGLYADYAVNDAMSLYANFSYWMSNEDELANGDNSPWKDADGYELTGRGAYKLADNVTYSAGAAYGAFKPDEGGSPDPYVRAFHKIQINF